MESRERAGLEVGLRRQEPEGDLVEFGPHWRNQRYFLVDTSRGVIAVGHVQCGCASRKAFSQRSWVDSETRCRDSGQQSKGGDGSMGRDSWAKSGVVFVFGIVSSMSHTTSWEAVDLQIRKMESWRARRRRRRKLASPTQHWSHHWKSCLGKPRAWTYRGGPDVPPCSLDAKSCVLSPACISRIVSFEAELFANSFDIVEVLLGCLPHPKPELQGRNSFRQRPHFFLS